MGFLCLSVTLLDGRFHGKADDNQPEWPPSPWRLFQALLAGAKTGCRHAEWRKEHDLAFCWLEKRDPPTIFAPEGRGLSAYQISVPNNDKDILARAWARHIEPSKTDAELRTLKPLRPTGCSAAETMTIHYVYDLAADEGSAPEVNTIRRICRLLHTFGWGIDAAFARARVLSTDEFKRLPGIRWSPQKEGARDAPCVRRVPTDGSLGNLLECYQQSTRRCADRKVFRPSMRPSVFRRVPYLPETNISACSTAAFELRNLDITAWRPFPQEEANVVAAMLRSLACRRAQDDSHPFPGGAETYVAGHTENTNDTQPRFSYIPLPTVGHPHADGLIRRVLIAEPHDGDGTQAKWARIRLRAQYLIDEHTQSPCARLCIANHRDPVLPHYIETASTWATVTPVILPGHDDHKRLKAERLLVRAISQAGIQISAVCGITLRKAPFWPGSCHPRQYRRPDYLQGLPAWHVCLEFREPVRGPIAIGAGRHCGLGVFAAKPETVK